VWSIVYLSKTGGKWAVIRLFGNSHRNSSLKREEKPFFTFHNPKMVGLQIDLDGSNSSKFKEWYNAEVSTDTSYI
jgi:hypothetical protein